MKRLQIIVLAIFVTIPLCAQKPLENDEIFATVGVNTPRGLMGEAGAGCRFDLGKTALATTVFIKGVYEPDNLVTDDAKYVEGWFTSLGLKVAWEF